MSEEQTYYYCGYPWEKERLKEIIDTKLTNEQASKLLSFVQSLDIKSKEESDEG